jgi:glutamate-5-semialdehyde dehydrogenase
MTADNEARVKAMAAKAASYVLARAPSPVRSRALLNMADRIWERREEILKANALDLEDFKSRGGSGALADRLLLNEKRLKEACDGLRQVASLQDPVGEVVEGWRTRHGLEIRKVRVPLGVVAVVYEARPNVTIDISGLAIKSGNAVVLRGGAEAINSNRAIVGAMKAGLEGLVPVDSIQLIESTDRRLVDELLKLDELIDVAIPRGGASFIKHVKEIATVPVIETGAGNCHIFVNLDADFEMANRIIVNAKVQRPSVCNAVRKVLVHRDIARDYIPLLMEVMRKHSVRVRGCEVTRSIAGDVEEATEQDWYEEYMDLTLAVKVVNSVEEAVEHINRYGTKHSDAIITKNIRDANYFTWNVDSACVYVNASTRFTDGGQFGFGAEVGISTQKLHARGPMALRELTTTKYIIMGDGQLRE